MCGSAQKTPGCLAENHCCDYTATNIREVVMRAEQPIIVLRRCIAVFIVAVAASAFIPWLDEAAANFERTDIGRYLRRMVSVPLALAAPPAAAGVESQSMRAE
jgi:hypothetical protein